MRFTRGVVKIPIKYLCVFVIVATTAFFVYLHILKHQRTRRQGQCRVLPPDARTQEAEKSSEKPRQNYTGCKREPEVNKFEDCPHCFRPTVKNVSSQLHQVQYSTSLFPRGPPDLFKPKRQMQQDFITSYLVTPSLVCVETCPYLVAILLSVSDDVDQRKAVRATWASVAKTLVWPNAQLNAHIQVIFVLAHQTEHSHIKPNEPQVPRKYVQQEEYPTLLQWTLIKEEADRFGDILYLNMQDSYYNLTLKLLSAFKWVDDHCPKAKFILKVDIDTFVNVPLLLDLLIVNEDRLEYSVLGKIYSEDRVVRRAHKWAVDAQIYPPAIFPVYASGCAYIVSARLLSRMVELSPYMPIVEIFDKLQWNLTTPTDLFFTSILGAVLGYDYFTVAVEMFTDERDTAWFWCDMIHDKKVVGKIFQKDGLYKMWRSVFRYYGKCWKEIPELANPKGH